MPPLKRKTPEERIDEILADPELCHILETKQAENLIKETDWSSIGDYIFYIEAHHIPHQLVNYKQDIESFAEDNKRNLQSRGEILSIIGDGDFVHDDIIYGTQIVQQNIRDCIARCGSGSLKTSMSSLVVKGGQPLKNALTLRDLGVEVKIRDTDESLRTIVVDQRNEEGLVKHKAACVWQSYAVEKDYARQDGLPQPPGKMNYRGWKSEMDFEPPIDLNPEKGFKASDFGPQGVILFGINDKSHYLWNGGKTIEDILAQKDRLEMTGSFRKNVY
jgi:hypothetical protein